MVEQGSDRLKKPSLPLVLLGSPPAALASLAPSFPSGENLPSELEFFVLLCLPEEEVPSAIDLLRKRGLGSDQILLLCSAPPSNRGTLVLDSFIGVLEWAPSDTTEELRIRLSMRLETQRHRKLAWQIEAARGAGVPQELSAEEWCLRMDAAHLTHGFSLALDLPPPRHGQSLRNALYRKSEEEGAPWDQRPLEELLALSARLALQHWQSPARFREEFRRLSAPLPFRLRTDLRNVVERCLESVWKGVSHVA